MYQFTTINTVQRLSDGAFIPFDPDNTDYQQYLAWLEEGNEPLPVNLDAAQLQESSAPKDGAVS